MWASGWTQKMKTAPYKEPTDSQHDELKSPEFHSYKSLKRFLTMTQSRTICGWLAEEEGWPPGVVIQAYNSSIESLKQRGSGQSHPQLYRESDACQSCRRPSHKCKEQKQWSSGCHGPEDGKDLPETDDSAMIV